MLLVVVQLLVSFANSNVRNQM